MSSTKNTANNSVSNNKTITRKDLMFSVIELQLDKREIGIIIVVNKTK